MRHRVVGVVRGINQAGEVVGGAALFGSGHRAFILNGTTLMNLGGFDGSDWGSALAVNDHGVVVGASNQASALRAFIWTSRGGIQDLGTLPGDSGSKAFGINNLGQVVGYSGGPGGIQAVRWASDGSIQALGTLREGENSRALAINELGDTVGSSGGSSGMRAFLWTADRGMEDLGTLSGHTESEAVDVSDHGEVVGHSASQSESRAFIWTRSDGMQDLGTLSGGNYSRARALNNRGDVVGNSESRLGSRPFLWRKEHGMQDLNALISRRSGFVLVEAVGVNDEGLIAALGIDSDGHENECSGACTCSRRQQGACEGTCRCSSNATGGAHHDVPFRLFFAPAVALTSSRGSIKAPLLRWSGLVFSREIRGTGRECRLGLARLILVILCFDASTLLAQPSVVGQWSSVPPLPIVPAHSHMLPTGMVVIHPVGNGQLPGGDARLWNPATATSSTLPPRWL